MSGPTPEHVARIAAVLSEAQRAAFLRSGDRQMHPTNAGRISTYGDPDVGVELHRLGLTVEPGTFSLATPLGLAVRHHLQKEHQL